MSDQITEDEESLVEQVERLPGLKSAQADVVRALCVQTRVLLSTAATMSDDGRLYAGQFALMGLVHRTHELLLDREMLKSFLSSLSS